MDPFSGDTMRAGRTYTMQRRSVWGLFFLVLCGACVTTGTHDAKVNELAQSVKREQAQEAELGRLRNDLAELQKRYDTAAATIGELKQRLQQLGQNVDQLASERGRLTAGLEDAEKRLEELRRQKAAAEARASTFRNLIDKLRSMIDAGQLKVTIRNGRMLIVLPNDVLFDSGRIDLKAAGKDTLTQVAQVLAGISDRRFLVSGHTDNVPIKTARFPSNWELSTGRAVEVAKLMVSGGMKPEVVGAAGYAEFSPVSSNEAPEGRAQNRRIEIILEPNLSDLPNLESLLSEVKR
jgi:chemotaxis protein MotB